MKNMPKVNIDVLKEICDTMGFTDEMCGEIYKWCVYTSTFINHYKYNKDAKKIRDDIVTCLSNSLDVILDHDLKRLALLECESSDTVILASLVNRIVFLDVAFEEKERAKELQNVLDDILKEREAFCEGVKKRFKFIRAEVEKNLYNFNVIRKTIDGGLYSFDDFFVARLGDCYELREDEYKVHLKKSKMPKNAEFSEMYEFGLYVFRGAIDLLDAFMDYDEEREAMSCYNKSMRELDKLMDESK